MTLAIPYDTTSLEINLPDSATVYTTNYPALEIDAAETVRTSIRRPISSPPLKDLLLSRRKGKVVIVVSDITRPIPYHEFLPTLMAEIESAGVKSDEILILVATGMHRPSLSEEREYLFGESALKYAIEDHDATGELKTLERFSLSGRPIALNESFVHAGFRIITGLVEPHFMAGFSGGRKSVCPGLVSLDTIQTFHGFEFLSNPRSANGVLEGNPCHEEALFIARHANVDFSLNLVLNREKRVIKAFSGGLEEAHGQACAFVGRHACPEVKDQADAVITGCGGYPLDATFYQCVKGIVGAVPAVKPGGMIIAAGACREHLGSRAYRDIMNRYAHDSQGFMEKIRGTDLVEKDQWQFQMQIRAIARVGPGGVVFLSSGLDEDERKHIAARSVHAEIGSAARALQGFVDRLATEGKNLAVIPEGPYCTPVLRGTERGTPHSA